MPNGLVVAESRIEYFRFRSLRLRNQAIIRDVPCNCLEFHRLPHRGFIAEVVCIADQTATQIPPQAHLSCLCHCAGSSNAMTHCSWGTHDSFSTGARRAQQGESPHRRGRPCHTFLHGEPGFRPFDFAHGRLWRLRRRQNGSILSCQRPRREQQIPFATGATATPLKPASQYQNYIDGAVCE